MMSRLRLRIRAPLARRDGGEQLARDGVADRGVVLAALEALEQRPIAAGQPPDPQPGQTIGLRHHVHRDRRRREVGGLREGAQRIELEPAVDLVAEQPDCVRVAQLGERRERGLVRQRSGRVVGEVDRDQARLGTDQAPERVEVERPAVLRPQHESLDVGPSSPARGSPSTGSWARSRLRARRVR